MTELRGVTLEREDAIAIVTIARDVDVVVAARLRDELLRAVANDDVGMVVDLSETGYIDSAGINVVFELAERLTARQLRLAVVVPERSLVERVLTIVDLGSVAEVAGTRDDALERVRATGGDAEHAAGPAS